MASTLGEGGFLALSAAALCCYEHLITLADEVRCIWRRRVSGATMLFLLNRYAILVLSVASIVNIVRWEDGPGAYVSQGKICATVIVLVDVCSVLVNIAYAAFAALRMFALSDLSKRVFTIVLTMGLFNPFGQIATMCMLTLATTSDKNAPVSLLMGRFNCFRLVGDTVVFHVHGPRRLVEFMSPALRVHGLVFEALLIVLTWKNTNTATVGIRTPCSTMFLRNGTMYFLAIAAAATVNLVGMVVLIASTPDSNTTSTLTAIAQAGPIVDAIVSVCMSRFVLGLLRISVEGGGTRMSTGTVVFASVGEEGGGGVFGVDLDLDLGGGDEEAEEGVAEDVR